MHTGSRDSRDLKKIRERVRNLTNNLTHRHAHTLRRGDAEKRRHREETLEKSIHPQTKTQNSNKTNTNIGKLLINGSMHY